MDNNKKKPVVIVTGGARGIGLAISSEFAKEGYWVVIGDMDEQEARVQAALLGEQHLGIHLDVTSEQSVQMVVETVLETYGHVDALINNAGIGDSSKPTFDQDLNYFEKVLSVHLSGTFLMSKTVGRTMVGQKSGSIVNISSIAGLTGIRGRNAYGAAKAGISSITRSMASEWAMEGVRVNAVAPGYVRTELVEKLISEGAVDDNAIRNRTPMGRLGNPEEIARPILFLCSDAASFLTGTTIPVDGGWSAFGEGCR